MAKEIKEKYPSINVINIANDKDLEETKKEIREILQYQYNNEKDRFIQKK